MWAMVQKKNIYKKWKFATRETEMERMEVDGETLNHW